MTDKNADMTDTVRITNTTSAAKGRRNKTMWTQIITFVCGGSFLAFLQFLITRHDNKVGKQAEILNAIKKLSNDVEIVKDDANRRDAVLARTHILRFDDELINGIKHSKEYFCQQLHDIDVYEQYCESHHDFQNSYAVMAIAHIRQTYKECLEENKFI
jgi:hypothetical protein